MFNMKDSFLTKFYNENHYGHFNMEAAITVHKKVA